MKNTIEALIFDMDGILIDSEPLHLEAFKLLLSTFGHQYSESYNRQFLGMKDTEITPQIIADFKLKIQPDEFIEKKDWHFHELIKKFGSPRAGVIETLKEARSLGVKVGLASSSKMDSIKLIVEVLKLKSYFDNLTSGEEVLRGKPEPDVFLLSAKRLLTDPHKCLVLEDSENGVKAAKKAGMFVVAIPCPATEHQEHLEADFKLSSMTELNLAPLVSTR